MSPTIEQRLDGLVPAIAVEIAHLRQPYPTMDGKHNPTPTETKLAGRIVEWVKFTMSDEWLTFCHGDIGYHVTPHRGCELQ